MMTLIVSILVAAAACVVVARAACVLYHSHWRTHPRHPWHWLAFGYSYVALAVGAVAGAVAIITGAREYDSLAALLLLIASAGLILFDRRQRRPSVWRPGP